MCFKFSTSYSWEMSALSRNRPRMAGHSSFGQSGQDLSVYEYSKFHLSFLVFVLLDYQHQYQYVSGCQEQ